MNKRLRRIGMIVIVGLITATFVLFFGQPSGQGSGNGSVANVNGEAVGRDAFEATRQRIANQLQELLPDSMDARRARDLIDQNTLASLMRRYVMAQEAASLGFRVSSRELGNLVCDIFDGRCEPEVVEQFISSSGYANARSFTNEVRRDALNAKLSRLIQSPIRISDAAVREQLRRDRVRVSLRYAVARSADFQGVIQLTDAEVGSFAEESVDRLRSAYDTRASVYQQPEQVRASHILFTGENAGDQAQTARARLDAGEPFAALAKELSQDQASRARGGDLGFFPRGRMLGAFDEAAFLAEPGAVQQLETERGVHLMRIEERREAVHRSFEDVQLELARELLVDTGGTNAAEKTAREMASLLASGQGFAAAARQLSLEVRETAPVSYREPAPPDLFAVADLKATAFSLRPESPSPARVFRSGGDFYLISLLERLEPAADSLTAEVEPTRERLEQNERGRAMTAWFSRRSRELRESSQFQTFPLYNRP